MSEMRLMVAGAGGRMGRTLVKAIADNKECKLAGALAVIAGHGAPPVAVVFTFSLHFL